ncbi:MAG TPA: SWIM zinc finger family protein, partial [Gammaproteobacteria bacterium]|nr:SWIM zinc finger family protein [Gammaproteobacteria bacterium]
MTQLARALSTDFDGVIRKRGEDYFHGGRVSVRSGSAWHVSATVRGTNRYKVELRREGEMLSVSCTCPYFDVEPCKHIWAVLLAADEQRFLLGRGGGRNRPLFLVQDGIEDSELDAADDLGDSNAEGGSDFEAEDGPDIGFNGHSESQQAQRQARTTASQAGAPRRNGNAKGPDWRQQLARLRPRAGEDPSFADRWPSGRELLYLVDADVLQNQHGLHLEVMFHDLKKDGTRGKPKARYLPREWLRQLPDADDRTILALLAGAAPAYSQPGFAYAGDDYYGSLPFRYRLLESQAELIVPSLCRTGRCRLRLHADDDHREWLPLAWEEADPWQFRLEISRSEKDDRYEVTGALRRGEDRMDLGDPLLILRAGIFFTRERAARFEHAGAFDWIALLREQNKLLVPAAQRDEFLAEFLSQPTLPAIDLPDELRYDEVRLPPRPRLSVKRQKDAYSRLRLSGALGFDYGGSIVAAGQPLRGIVQAAERRVILRDSEAELAAAERLQQLGWRQSVPRYSMPHTEPGLELPAHLLPQVVQDLLTSGWHVEAEGKAYRSAGRIEVEVSSGIDWFELHGAVEFGGAVAQLPKLLQALRRGEHMVTLDDGSFGLLPKEWLERYGQLAELGTAHKDHLRFMRSQVGLLDALLAAQPEAKCDTLFAELRDKLARFD